MNDSRVNFSHIGEIFILRDKRFAFGILLQDIIDLFDLPHIIVDKPSVSP